MFVTLLASSDTTLKVACVTSVIRILQCRKQEKVLLTLDL